MKTPFRHRGCVYGSDAEFLTMAVPFAEDGLRRRQPVLAVTTAGNLGLLRAALGVDADRIECAETSAFGRRASHWAEALRDHWTRHRSDTPPGPVRIIAEPAWADRSRREVAAWLRMEANLTMSLADTEIWMICPYDTRSVEAGIVEEAHRIHPECVVGRRAKPSAQFMVPEEFTQAETSPGRTADLFRFAGDLVSVRRYVLEKATPILSTESTSAMFDVAVGAVLASLLNHGIDRATVWVRPVAGRVVCTMRCDRPLDLQRFPGSGHLDTNRLDNNLRMAEQVCEWLDVSSDPGGCTIELAMPGQVPKSQAGAGSEGWSVQG
ncbi:MEDS domain-containing protein [Amycolatopsis coloradensis]|uniref:MEDS domain-containing protein n=1 Tax=Amycolatopsis coloradensis TaxID=76021 RepID=A0ACD5BIY4_9PSEU